MLPAGFFVYICRMDINRLLSILASHRRAVSPRDLSYIPDEEPVLRRLYDRIVVYMDDKTPYLDGDFSIGDLSRHMFTNKVRVSKTVNHCYGKNFRSFINEYRIRYAADLIKKDPRMKMEEVARLSGFNTMPTFNAAFKNFMHERPSEYQARVKGR